MTDSIELYKLHVATAHTNEIKTQSMSQTDRRPITTSELSEEEWDYFKASWGQYRAAANLQGGHIVSQLMECCSNQLWTLDTLVKFVESKQPQDSNDNAETDIEKTETTTEGERGKIGRAHV